MTLSKLSLRNARRQAGDYLVYFVTITLVAALIYAFNGLVFSAEVQELSESMSTVPVMVVMASVLVVGVVGWLVSYTTRFMLIRRSREFGTYILIGLENNQVARLFFLENLAVGGCALVLGIFLGNLLYQALRAIILAMFGVPYHFSFVFSLKGVALTLVYFSAIYLIAQQRSRRKIRRMRIYELIYFERQNEEAVIKTGKNRRRLFAGSIFLGIAGTVLLLMGGMGFFLAGACLLVVFFFGFFLSFASGVPAFFEKRPAAKYRGQNLLVFRTLTAKLAAMGVTMATIALLFTATLISEGAGMDLRGLIQGRVTKNACFDLLLGTDDLQAESHKAGMEYVQNQIPLRESRQYEVYMLETGKVREYVESHTRYYTEYNQDPVMKASDYMALREMLGYPPVTLEPGKYLIHCLPYVADALKGFSEELDIGGDMFSFGGIHTEVFAQHMYDLGNGIDFILVAPDEAVEGCRVKHTIFAAMTEKPVSEEQYGRLRALRDEMMWNGEAYVPENTMCYVKSEEESEAASSMAITIFPLYYLALVLIMAAAAILTIQQLGEAAHYRSQFALLRKLGMERREMGKALRRQFAIYYAMPAVFPVLIGAAFVINMAGSSEPGTMTGASHPLVITAMTLGIFLLIYGGYILMAYSSMKRSVLPLDNGVSKCFGKSFRT